MSFLKGILCGLMETIGGNDRFRVAIPVNLQHFDAQLDMEHLIGIAYLLQALEQLAR